MKDMTDNQLMGCVSNGDLEPLGLLFERHSTKVHALCCRMTGSGESANDLVQETFLRILRYRKSFRGEAAFTTWMYRVARNTCLDHLKSIDRDGARLKRYQQTSVAPVPAGEDVAKERRLRRLERALRELPDTQREVLVLSRYLGLKYREIAEVQECDVGAVKARAHRGLRRLRLLFDKLEDEDHAL